MRSVLVVIGGEIRHLRYPLQVVEDINQILPGGFFSVFDLEADLQTAHLLLWAGLQHEGLTYEDAGCVLITEGAAYDPITLIGFWKKITDALVNDAWISIQEKGEGEPKPLSEVIADMERIAIAEMDMRPAELYGLTPREFNLIRDNHGLRANKRTGIICATMADIHAPRKDGQAYKPGSFIRTGDVAKPQTVEEQAAILGGAF